ncbi:Lactose permease [Drechslerella dactyloides]|uniref:Lactose permease n=1 Tax=Drechslerella dactyloides TaxID=74499 RepID=A0AAD6NLU6_DREDA|nr:Lactose permease [Drechslerella dactyloides]
MLVEMAKDEVELGRQVTRDDASDIKKTEDVHVEEVAVARLTEEDMFSLSQENLNLRSQTGWRIAGVMFVQGCNMAGYGVDWGVIGAINSFPAWHEYYGFGNSGSTYGILNALMTIGNFCGSPLLAFGDVIGRRGINFAGNACVAVASVMQAFAVNIQMLMFARFLLGFGTGMMSSSQYMAEISPIHLRGRLVGIFGACFQIGSLATSGAMIGFQKIEGNWSWRAPFLVQALFPITTCISMYLLSPETPRFLVMRGKREKAKEVVARYMTTAADPNTPFVEAVVSQIEHSLEEDTSEFRDFWDFRVFFTKPVRYRLMLLTSYSIFQQWNGGGIIGYYLSPALDTVGITDPTSQLGINTGLVATYFVFTLLGAYIVDLFRRRTLIFAGLISFVLLQTAVTITGWQYQVTDGSRATSVLTIVWYFSFQVCSATLIATMHNLYPVEILSLVLRAKGMGLYGLIQGAAGTVQSYGISVGINKLGYKIWCVYIVYNFLQLILSYFIFPETYKLSLEEIDAVFETKGVHPVKMAQKLQDAKAEMARIEREGRDGRTAHA